MASGQEDHVKLNISSYLSGPSSNAQQIDIFVLDFDTVPNDGLLSKLKHYGIYDKIWLWIYNFQKKTCVKGGGFYSLK